MTLILVHLYIWNVDPPGFPTEGAQHELLLWKISEWADPFATLPSLSVFVYSAEKQYLPLTQPGMNLKVLEAVKMGRKIVLEREKMKIVIRYSHNARKGAFLRKGIMTLGDYAQLQ